MASKAVAPRTEDDPVAEIEEPVERPAVRVS